MIYKPNDMECWNDNAILKKDSDNDNDMISFIFVELESSNRLLAMQYIDLNFWGISEVDFIGSRNTTMIENDRISAGIVPYLHIHTYISS
jgi:hypothetical protein